MCRSLKHLVAAFILCLLCYANAFNLRRVHTKTAVHKYPSFLERSLKMKVTIPLNMPGSFASIKSGNTPNLQFLSVPFKQISLFWKSSLLILVALATKLQNKAKKAQNAMEDGWVKRGSGSATARTIEVWRFAFSFLFKFVRIYKLLKSSHFPLRLNPFCFNTPS